MSFDFAFRRENPDVDYRKNECQKIFDNYPNKLPIICEKDPKCKNMQELDKTKFLVPQDMLVSQFMQLLRTKIQLADKQAFFLVVEGNHSIAGDNSLLDVYHKFKNKEDNFLYIMYSSEEAWGNNLNYIIKNNN